MHKNITRRAFIRTGTGIAALGATACAAPPAQDEQAAPSTPTPQQETSEPAQQPSSARVDDLLASLSLEQKIAQMIMPAIRSWDGANVTNLGDFPELAGALRRHQYGGIILFGQNIENTAQTVRLVSDLQTNNASSDDAQRTGVIPYLVSADQEGGTVARLSMGTRGTGSMAIGATGANAEKSALDTGTVFGEELAALGINVNLAPCLDIIRDLGDAGMSTRVFADDAETVRRCGTAFAKGLAQSKVVTTYKHFPGAGDGSDYPTAVNLSLDELREQGLRAYAGAIEDGADMLMTAAVTFPNIDDAVVLADGVSMGYYPATMSPKIVGEILREELGYNGVVMTDALEMDQFYEEPNTGALLLPGARYTSEHAINIAHKCIVAGCDILLIPTDLADAERASFYDAYIQGIASLVEAGEIGAERIDESARRILTVKEKYGLLDLDVSGVNLDSQIAQAQEVVGSAAHHDVERGIAEAAVTVLKDDGLLPIPGTGTNVVLLGRTYYDETPLLYALGELQEAGIIDPNARVVNTISGTTSGSSDSTSVFIARYYDYDIGLSFTSEITNAIAQADYVVCLSAVGPGIQAVQDSDLFVQGVSSALATAKQAGVPFVLLSDNLPVDAARFADADAIVCAYLSAGFDVDPTTRKDGSGNVRAINANVPAALRAIFGAAEAAGTLPINIPVMAQDAAGTWYYTDEVLYARGSGV